MKPRRNRRRAFSRLELLTLGAVCALSLLALWPAFAQFGIFDVFIRARQNARQSSCQSNLKQVGLAALQYMQDYDEMMPPITTPEKVSYGYAGYGWAGLIQPYIKSAQIYQCPAERNVIAPGGATPDATKPGYTDYWMNRRLSRRSLAYVESPAQTLLFGDGDGGSPQSNARYSLDMLPGSWRYNSASPARRHLGKGNYAFVDGHVKGYEPPAITMAPLSQLGKYNASGTFSPR